MMNIPIKPAIKSREIRATSKFSACVTRAGLIVQRHSSGAGNCLPVSHPQYAEYVHHMETSIDEAEFDSLCRALM